MRDAPTGAKIDTNATASGRLLADDLDPERRNRSNASSTDIRQALQVGPNSLRTFDSKSFLGLLRVCKDFMAVLFQGDSVDKDANV